MKRLLLKLWYFIMRSVRKLNVEVERLVPIASNIVEAVKTVLANPAFSFTTSIVKKLIPGELDDVIIDKAVKLANIHIPRIALQLGIIESLTEIVDPREQLALVFQQLENVSKEQWQKFCSQLAQQIVVDMADNKITWGEAGVYVELYYKTYLKNN